MRWNTRSITLNRNVHLIGLTIVIGVTAALATSNYFIWNAAVTGINLGQRDRVVTEHISTLLIGLADAESAERGYLLSGEDSWLQSYSTALSRVRATLADISSPGFALAGGNLAAKLAPLVSARLADLDRSIDLRRTADSRQGLRLLQEDQGTQNMNAIRELCAKLLAAQQERFAARAASVRDRNTRTRIALILGSAGVVLILGLFGFSVHRLIRGREQVIRDLDAARNDSERTKEALDTTLRSIGDAVVATDASGRITFMNPVAEQLTGWLAEDGFGRAVEEVFQLVDESTRKAVEGPLARALRDGVIVELANGTVLIGRSGRPLPIDDSGAPIRDKTGTVTGAVLVFRDITERHRARKRLEDSERRYRLLFEINPQPVWVYDVNTLRFLAVNSAAVELFDYRREEYDNLTVRDIRPAEDFPSMLDAMRQSAMISRVGPARHRKKDGSIILLEVTAHPLEFDGHNARIVLATDVTEKLAAEESLLQAHELLKALVDTAPVAVLTIDLEGRVTSWNATAAELFQWSREEVMGKPLPIIPENERAAFNSLLENYRGGYQVSGLETVRVRKDGFLIPVSIWSAPLTDKQGRRTGILGIVADLSQRKRDERALVDTEHGFRLLFESNPQPMWVFHRETLQFLELNRAAIAHYGYSREEFLSMFLGDVVRNQDIPRLLHSIGGDRPLQNVGVGEHRLKSGLLIEVEAVVHSLEFKGAPAILAVLKDITEWKKIEGQIRDSQKLEAVGRLAGGVAHDFNNLLTVISGYAELLSQSRAVREADRIRIDEIAKAADRAAGLTRQLLAFSRRQILQPRTLLLNDNVLKIQKMLSRLLGEDIHLQTELASDLWQVLADPTQIDQIIMNLAINARDAMELGGTLTIQTSNVIVDDAHSAAYIGVEKGEFVALSVSDTGHGMDAETKAHIFEPFFTTKEPGRGTGLGLATVYGIVKQTGGSVIVYSEPGQGTRIIIYLPRTMGESVEMPPAAAGAPQTGTETILLVEDDESVGKLVTVMLESVGYTAIRASSGEEALTICRDLDIHIDLIISDLVLPHMGGQEIARRAREYRPRLKVLFMSGYTEHAALRPGRFEAGEFFIQKPFSQGELTIKVRDVLGERITRTIHAGA